MKLLKWLTNKNIDTAEDSVHTGIGSAEKYETLTPNMRALRLAMNIADLMLSMGVSANSAVSRALDVTETYCARPVHIDITSTLIFLSQIRSIEKEPLTLIRPMTERDINYITLRNVQTLVHRIREGKVTLDQAEQGFDDIMKNPTAYPWWIQMMGSGMIVAGIAMFYSTDLVVIAISFLLGVLANRMLFYLYKYAISPFFIQVIIAMTMTVIAAVINLLGKSGVDFLAGINPSLIVVAGIVLLVAGLAVVAAMQDAIEEYYLTSSARMMSVVLQTMGIVIGVMIGLYVARKLGIGIVASHEPLDASPLAWQLFGAYVLTVGFAIGRHTQLRAAVWIGVVGVVALGVYTIMLQQYQFHAIPAAGIAAAAVGVLGAIMARFWYTPSIGILSAGIVSLVPGLMLYRGLMQLISYPPGDPDFFRAAGTLSTVVAIGLIIAAGASLGNMMGKPVHQRLARARNFTPFMEFIRQQSSTSRRHYMGFLALRPHTRSSKSSSRGQDQDAEITGLEG